MDRTPRTNPRVAAASRRRHGAGFVLIAVALAALAAGCVQNHDPRSDSSRPVEMAGISSTN